MKTMKLFLLLAGATLLVAGCNKQNPFGGNYSRMPGDQVVFGVGAGSMETRTVYGDVKTENSKKIQAINWVAGDRIRVYSPDATRGNLSNAAHWNDYTVTPVTGTENKGTLACVQSPGLAWKDNGNHTFYSVYPSPGTTEADVLDEYGVFSFTMPATQLVTDEMEYAFMTAAAKENAGVTGDAVELDFYPAYTAFEFILKADQQVTLKSFTLSALGDGAPALTGAFTVTYNGTTPAYASTGTGKTITIADMANTVIDATHPASFKVFCLPQLLSHLKIQFTVRGQGWTKDETRSLLLNYADGSPVEFAARKIHKISGTMQGLYNFKYITLEGQAVDWEAVEVTENSDKLPQTSQFYVSGVHNVYELHNTAEGKALRQTWILGDNTATVSFKIFSPEGGSWEIVPQGAVDKFTVNGTTPATLSGSINTRTQEASSGATKVTFTVSPNGASAGDQIWFKTYVYTGADKTGDKISIDSETQLYDIRGFHYFRIDDPLQ